MGKIVVHEFISLDGVIEDPTFTFGYPFAPKMGDAIAQAMGPCKAILLGRRTLRCSRPHGPSGPPPKTPAPLS